MLLKAVVKIILVLLHHGDEFIEQIISFMRTRAGFRMALKTKSRFIGQFESLQTAIKKRHMGNADISGQGARIDGEAVILASDDHFSGGDILNRMIGAVMAEFHFDGTRAAGQAEHLMAEANAENRNVFCSNVCVAEMA